MRSGLFTRRFRRAGAAIAALGVSAGILGGMAGPASAVHDQAFELDGDVTTQGSTQYGSPTYDWASLFDASGHPTALPADFTASAFTADFKVKANGTFNTSDSTTFATGSKDTLPIGSGWQCTFSNNVNSKVDVMNAYAAAYTDPSTQHEIVYFALERNTNTGDGNVAFWFLQDQVGCVSAGSTASFTGEHTDGDLLVVSAFTNGGTVSNVDVYRWNGGANGTLGTTPVAAGVDCKASGQNDSVCATVNGLTDGPNGTITTPWATANAKDGVGTTLREAEFFEGGLDLTASNLGDRCFNVFIGDTRSSQSLTATLFDYAEGALGACTSSVVTTPTPSHAAPTTIPASGSLTSTDSAELTVTGVGSFNGTLTYNLCGPLPAESTSTCDSGGAQIGDPQTVTASGTYTSPVATITEAGRYCWRADFSGDEAIGVPASSDHSDSECFLVNPVQPAISTQAGAGPVDFGDAVTDEATLTGTANQPGTGGLGDGSINPTTAGGSAAGSVSFTLYKDDCATPATGTGTNPQTVTVSGDGTYGPVSFTPDAPGTYHWVATYSGDSPNTRASLASDSPCPDGSETVVVRQIPTAISTAQSVYPNDSATITSSVAGNSLPTTGTVSFTLYGPTSGQTALQNCQAGGSTGSLYSQTLTNVGGAHSVTVSTTNTTTAVNTSDTYYWLVTYTPGDSAHLGRQSQCSESTALSFTNDAGPGTAYP